MIDPVKLTALIEPLQRVVVLCPRRCGKGAFLTNYIDNQTCETVFLGLTANVCRDMRLHLNRNVLCTTGGANNRAEIRRAALLVIDEGLFMNEAVLFPLFDDQRIVVLSSLTPDMNHVGRRFAAAGFVTIDAPLL